MRSVQGRFTLIDFRKAFWNGTQVQGVENVFIQADQDSEMVKLVVRNGDESILSEMEAAGIKIRRLV